MNNTVWWNATLYAGLTVAKDTDAATVTVELDDNSPVELGSTVWVLPKLNGKTTSMALSVNGVPGGNAMFGIIDEHNCLFVAPRVMPPGGKVTITATTRMEPRRSGSVVLTLKAPATAPVIAPPSPAGEPDAMRRNAHLNMANGKDPLRQRMIAALSQIFVPAGSHPYGNANHPWLATLSNNAFGNYKTLLLEMTLNRAMAEGGAGNASALHEKHAREMMQLFTTGPVLLNQDGTVRLDRNGTPIPTDDEALVAELAGALAACTDAGDGARTILNGVALPAGLTTVIDTLFKHPNVPPFIATRLIRHFVTSNPSHGYVRRVAEAFAFGAGGRGDRGDLKATMLAVLTDLEARNDSVAPTIGRAVEDLCAA